MPFAELSPAHQALLGVALPLLALMALGIAARGVARVLLVAQAVYWLLAYLPRPLVLLAVTPAPTFGDDLADPRLAVPGYDYTLARVLEPLAPALWIYVGFVAAYVLWQRCSPRVPRTLATPGPLVVATFATVWLASWPLRVYSYLSGQAGTAGQVVVANPYLSLFTDAGAIGALGVILFARRPSPTATWALIAVAVAGELAWGVAEESKTPFLGAVLALVVRVGAGRLTAARLAGVGVAGLGVAAVFGWLQSFKVDAATAAATAGSDAAYPTALHPVLTVLRRFDLIAASVDAYYLDGRPYVDLADLGSRLVINLVPQQLGAEKIASGADWAQRVRGSSVDMTGISVSLAEGHINEGLVIGGLWGVAVESVVVLAALAAVARILTTRCIPLLAVAIAFVSAPVLFERGALGISETLGKSLQQAALVTAVAAAVWLWRALRAGDRPPDDPPAAVPADTTPTARRKVPS